MTRPPRRTIVVVGEGGREHALALRLAADPEPARVVLMPGNDGAARGFECRPEREPDAVVAACLREAADLVVIGPETAIAAGLADRLNGAGVAAFGASAEAGRIESSKWFAKQVMAEAGVPTGEAECFEEPDDVVAAMPRFGPPWVLKVDGLAAGKGVCVTSDPAEAMAFARASLAGGRFGVAGRRVLLERHLAGEEVSVMALCDGERSLLLPAARDYKRARDGDAGPNTGGMGAFAPVPELDRGQQAIVRERIVDPVLAALRRRGTPFRGALYCGLMLTAAGPQVVEFNARLGDPETQVILPRVGGSLADLLLAAARGSLAGRALEPRPGATVAVALVDEGYPEAPRGLGTITGAEAIDGAAGAWMVYAGVRAAAEGWRVAGGRAAYACAEDETLEGARRRAYAAVARLGGSGWRFRRDVARVGAPTPGRT